MDRLSQGLNWVLRCQIVRIHLTRTRSSLTEVCANPKPHWTLPPSPPWRRGALHSEVASAALPRPAYRHPLPIWEANRKEILLRRIWSLPAASTGKRYPQVGSNIMLRSGVLQYAHIPPSWIRLLLRTGWCFYSVKSVLAVPFWQCPY